MIALKRKKANKKKASCANWLLLLVLLQLCRFEANAQGGSGENVAYQRPVRSNLSKSLVKNVTDGDLSSTWSGSFFPAYVDVDLMDTYEINRVGVYFPKGKKSYYSLYGSNDGKNYDLIYRTRVAKPASADGDQVLFDLPKTYRIVRVYVEFTDADSKTKCCF